MKNIIEVVPYNPEWPKIFKAEAELIQEALGDNCVTIHHIGSTSVVGLSAKPIIDIIPVVKDIQTVVGMEALGYENKGENGIAFRRFFKKETFNVHVYQKGDTEIDRYLKFRDWMLLNPEDANRYAKLKERLAEQFSNDMLGYCNGKDAFVASIDVKTGFDGWRMVQALTDREWSSAKNLRKHFFKEKDDPYTWTFEHKDHIHFMFYKNADIIGYAHIQLWPEKRAALRIIVIDERYRNMGFGCLFLKQCERWLSHQGYKKLLIQSSPRAYKFYSSNGYIQMPFNDPVGHATDSNDIEIGKDIRY